jgi:hypothetical protein
LHGVVLVTVELGTQFDIGGSNTWLWDGAQWSTLPVGNFTPCVGSPASGAWDAVHSQVVVVMAGQCRTAGGFPPSETWLFDGRAWRRAGVAPAGVVRPSLAWDVTANHVVMLQADPAVGLGEWSWGGQAWAPVGAPDKGAPQPTQLGGAGFDAKASGVVTLPASGPLLAYVVKEGMWSTLNTTTVPQRVVALTGDSTNHRVLVLGEAPVPVNSTPDAVATGDFLMTWSGHTWDLL